VREGGELPKYAVVFLQCAFSGRFSPGTTGTTCPAPTATARTSSATPATCTCVGGLPRPSRRRGACPGPGRGPGGAGRPSQAPVQLAGGRVDPGTSPPLRLSDEEGRLLHDRVAANRGLLLECHLFGVGTSWPSWATASSELGTRSARGGRSSTCGTGGRPGSRRPPQRKKASTTRGGGLVSRYCTNTSACCSPSRPGARALLDTHPLHRRHAGYTRAQKKRRDLAPFPSATTRRGSL
jgi:hypothetical protein